MCMRLYDVCSSVFSLHMVCYSVVKRAYRLRRPNQFQRVRREGTKANHQFLLLHAATNRHRKTRCGFVIGKRIGNAVQRNRAKRRVREAVRLMLHHIPPGIDMVFVVRTAEVARIPFSQLQEVVESLLRSIGAWREEGTSEQSYLT